MASFLSFLRYGVNNQWRVFLVSCGMVLIMAVASFLSFLRYGVNKQWRVFLVSCGMVLIISGEFS